MKKQKNMYPRYGYRVLGKGRRISNDTMLTHLNNNDLICGSSGSSKTGSVVYTQLKTVTDSSLIVADTKGRLSKLFSKELKSRGYDVLCLDFVNPENSCKYNPIDYIRRNRDGSVREQDIAKIVASLIPTENSDELFWPLAARSVLEFFVAYMMEALPPVDHNMYTVGKLYRAFASDAACGERGFMDFIENNPDSFTAKRYSMVKSMQNAERMMSSIYGFVNTALYPFDASELKHIYDPGSPSGRRPRRKLDIAKLGRRKTVLFLNIPDSDHSVDNLVNLFYTQALQTLISEADGNPDGRLRIPVRIMMDDFASSTTIPDFDRIISVVRSRDIWLTLSIQSFTQLESIYSHNQALTIINNCDHIVYLGSNDMESASFIGTRALKTPETVLAMDRSKEYFIEGGKTAELIDKVPPYSYTEDEAEPEQ